MKKALITGISGFVGSHLAEHLISKGISVFGITHPSHPSNNLQKIASKINIFPCDITNSLSLKKLIDWQKFDYVFHLAAFSSPSQSFKNPKDSLENNIIGQLNILEQMVKANSTAKILIVGSADEYGNVDSKYLPINEQTPLNPNSPYAVSKLAQDFLGLQYFLHNRLNVIRVRPFSHIGPRQSNNFVVSSFASQIAQVEKKGKGILKVGNLDPWRDFTDVRDMSRAYLAALEMGKFGEVYNIGSGKAYKIADILKKLIAFSTAKIKIEQEKSLMRETDIKKVVCDFSKFNKDTGWQPKIDIDTTLFDTMEYERKKLK